MSDITKNHDGTHRTESPSVFIPEHGRGNLLIVDDEQEICRALYRLFRRHYDVHTACSAEEGSRLLQTKDIHVIISDQRMPKVTGADFFRSIRPEFPDTIRLLLTGYADINAVIAAINGGEVFRYITKPWDPAELTSIVRQAFDRYWLMLQNRQLVEELRQLNENLEQQVEHRTRQLAEANEHLTLLNAQKNRFLGIAAHDLRSPLAVVESAAESLARTAGGTTGDRQSLIDMILRNCRNMRKLVDDLLDITNIEQGTIEIRHRVVNLREFVSTVAQLNRRISEPKGIRLVYEIPQQPSDFRLDPDRIEQVLNNLIGNSIKFSHGGTTIRLVVSRHASCLRFSVCDEGLGIAPEEIPKLFEEFQQTSTQATAGEQGAGLGLAICKRIVSLHGGSVGVDSQLGHGSCFWFELPYQRAEADSCEPSHQAV